MVLDVTRWLPEHPGGSRIIPAQSLNLDCARFFEVHVPFVPAKADLPDILQHDSHVSG